MAATPVPRRRGGLCGFLLVLLGLWGALAPFAGPYFHFGFTPDRAWAYSSGRLYLSVLPGAVALLGGLLVVATRNRAAGVFGGLLAVIAGAWFAVGNVIVAALHHSGISPGVPIGAVTVQHGAGLTTAGALPWRVAAEYLSLSWGLGVAVVLFGALAAGRLSLLSAQDAAAAQQARDQQAREPQGSNEPRGNFEPLAGYDSAGGRSQPAGYGPQAGSTRPFPQVPAGPEPAGYQKSPGPATAEAPTVTRDQPGQAP